MAITGVEVGDLTESENKLFDNPYFAIEFISVEENGEQDDVKTAIHIHGMDEDKVWYLKQMLAYLAEQL